MQAFFSMQKRGENMKKLSRRPIFTIVGAEFILNGIFFIVHDSYFKWPPQIAPIENDDIFGGLFVLFGLGMLLSKAFPDEFRKIEPYIMAGASIIQMFLAIVEFMHFIKLGMNMPWIPNLCIALIIPVLATRSDVK